MTLVATRSRGLVRRTALGTSIVVFAATAVTAALTGCGNSAELRIGGSDDAGQDGSRPRDGGTGGSGFLGDPDASRKDGAGTDTGTPVTDCDGGSDSGCLPSTQCGNSQIDVGEGCDDGNLRPGDGCDGTCQKEGTNWDCPTPGAPCVRLDVPVVCGDGIIETGEECDRGTEADGGSNNDGVHGCTPACKRMPGWFCPTDGSACFKPCGDGLVQNTLGEQCDDGVNDGTKGCTTGCQVVVGWSCPPQGGACTVDVYCGNGVVQNAEQCDDHNRRSYDGCSATCFVEPGWSCPPNGGACSRICGNGTIDAGEGCDDGNIYSGDGCSSSCRVETNYTCPDPGHPCVYTPPAGPAQCGNGTVDTGEQCDDGNANSGDGCSATCQLQPGWTCPVPKQPCVALQCGDGILAGTEQCDDGNAIANDGCTGCVIDANAICPGTGGACTPMRCGDGLITGTEQCDDGNATAGDGCDASCQIETGWQCPVVALKCVPKLCGDGIAVGAEQCDEGGEVDCCTADCKLKPNFVCDPSKSPHSQPASAYCGNGTKETPTSTIRGLEQCDDSNTMPFDGCSPTCKNEPLCGKYDTTLTPAPTTPTDYQCYMHCGDGLKMSLEECDDGNIVDGDGCDHNCKVERNPNTGSPAWNCSQPAVTAVSIPVIWRDFTPRSHPQFEILPSSFVRLAGIAEDNLVPTQISASPLRYRNVPKYNTSFSASGTIAWTMNGPGWTGVDTTGLDATRAATLTVGNANPLLSPEGRYAQWYIDDSTVNMPFAGTINLTETPAGSGTYQYSCDKTMGCSSSSFPGNPVGFFPIDNRGWVATNPVKETARDGNHNYHFTTEARYWFVFNGGEQLQFYGDDDVWVFVNGKLALDLGGIHNTLNGYFTLNNDGSALTCAEDSYQQWGSPTPTFPTSGATCKTVALGLTPGYVYEVAVFHAERHVTESNFRLTIKGFNNSPTVCTPICNDGYVVGNEQCDRGAANVNPNLPDGGTASTYGQCTTSCTLGPYCGDKRKDTPPEACDNGVNTAVHAASLAAAALTCASNCQPPAYCGDGVRQANYGEECDDPQGNQDAYGHCQTNCLLGPRCGDGSVQPGSGEQCDDGPNNGAASSGCGTDCKAKCGNGVVDVGEKCDDGVNNGTAASVCTTSCQSKCGDGQLEAGEQCDDGKNDGTYGTCKSDCTYAPYCGDNLIQDPNGEKCDNGAANSPTAYGQGSCTDQCLPGGYCGDGIINGSEKCDDGVNSGRPGSCLADCSGYVPSSSCGDGVVQEPEKCDDGAANGTATSACDASCRKKCGNGFVEAGEQCDNGVNDGTYGTCKPDCTLAGYCGDGTKNGPEQCDEGAGNVPTSTAYGTNVCTTSCTWAPFCGDGHLQTQFHEDCEGYTQCVNCHSTVPPVN